MNSLHNLVASGKVLYLGVSDTPAWIVTKANTYAKLTGKTPFVIYQGAWSIVERDIERDIVPMCVQEGKRFLLNIPSNLRLSCTHVRTRPGSLERSR